MIKDGRGGLLYSQDDIAAEASRYFQNQYKRNQSNISDMLWVADLIPEMFDEDSYENFIKPVTEDELLSAIKSFKKDKSPGPDGWPIEFFMHFYDMFKMDLLRMVEASRMSGNIHSALSSTFIALIPKKYRSDSFQDFRPISLCNTLMKIISKIVAKRLKPILNIFISRDQHAFLKDRNIWDVVAMTQECLYSMVMNNTEAAILKIDLKKAYDCVDWGLLRILLAKVGLRKKGIEWVMACVENVQYSIIINGIPSSFFKAERGLRQGCPLSPLLFILVMNSLSLQINKAVADRRCRLVKILALLGIGQDSIRNGIKYLRFNLKAKGNRKQEWLWLIDRFYRKISGWEWRLLSLAGRFILVQAVLSQLAVYWAHIYLLPASIIKQMHSLAANFLWGGKSFQSKIHLVKMEDISRLRKESGWGLLNMRTFGNALLCKSLHRGIFGEGPWSKLINRKYLKGRGMEYWYRRNSLGIKRGSAIWLSLRKLQPFFMENLRWRIYSGTNILIGFDSIINGLVSLIPSPLVRFLHAKGFFTWDKLIKAWSHSSPVWIDGSDLHLPPSLHPLWESTVQSLSGLEIHRSGTKDVLAWALPHTPLPICVKHLYAALSKRSAISSQLVFPMPLWKVTCPLKMVLFSWLIFCNRNLTWEVLQRKGWQGPGCCAMCQNAVESNLHMFFQCPSSMLIWYDLSISFGFPYLIFSSVQYDFMWWSGQSESWRSLFVHACWLIWKWRNGTIFQNSRMPVSTLLCYIKANHDFSG
eukprot:PITA_32611